MLLLQLIGIIGLYLLIFTSHRLLGICILLALGVLLNLLIKGGEKDRQEFARKRRDPFTYNGTFHDITYYAVSSRNSFHQYLVEEEKNCFSDSYTLAKKDELGRIVGGFITFTGKEISERGRYIKEGVIERDAEARKEAYIPGFNAVKNRKGEINGESFPLYHRTLLVPFRYSLNYGEYNDVMFAGTARLNIGIRASDNYIPTYEDHARNVKEIISRTKGNPFYYKDSKNTEHLSLHDFSFVITEIIHRGFEEYNHTYRYGVECFYSNDNLIPDVVEVVLIDITAQKSIFVASLWNRE